jgi:aminoglycoside phosphotransferase (APT) family kinase protein
MRDAEPHEPYRPPMAHERNAEARPLSRAQVSAFLTTRHAQRVDDLERLGGGWWSSAWGYRVGDEELVVRIGPDAAWYEADRMAMAFAGPDLPVPEVREIGNLPDGRAYAISVRHRGVFLEDVPSESSGALGPTLAGLLLALRAVPTDPQSPVLWHQRGATPTSWREFLMAGLVDDPSSVAHGWSASVAADPRLAALSAKIVEVIQGLIEAIPERRDLVHGDLLHGNVLVGPDAKRVETVFSWKCSVRGDFLFDAAWCSFWAPWHPGIAAADPLPRVLSAPSVRAEPSALDDASARHHCYELQIGFTHLGWNIWTGNQQDLVKTVNRLSEVLERGPLRLDVPSSSL